MNLESLLKSAGSQGELDSEGHFTIDSRKASAKLAAFQLPQPTNWVRKIAQAAVSSGAAKLEVKQTGEITLFQWYPPLPPSYEALRESFAGTTPSTDPTIQHLTVGLRAVGVGQTRDFAVVLVGSGSTATFECRSGELSLSVTESEVPLPSVTIAVRHPNESTGLFKKLPKSVVSEGLELAWGCQVSPIEVRLDGRRLDTLAATALDTERDKTRLDLAVIWRPRPVDSVLAPMSVPPGLYVGPLSWRPTDRFTDARTFAVDGPGQREDLGFLARLAFVFRVTNNGQGKGQSFQFETYKGPSFVHWVRDGVVITRKELVLSHWPVRLDLFLAAQDLDTDISGLNLAEGPLYKRRLAQGLKLAAQSLEQTAMSIQNHTDQGLDFSTLTLGGFITMHGLVMAIGSKGITIPFHLAFGTVMYKQLLENRAKVRLECLESLRMLQEQMSHLADGL